MEAVKGQVDVGRRGMTLEGAREEGFMGLGMEVEVEVAMDIVGEEGRFRWGRGGVFGSENRELDPQNTTWTRSEGGR